MIRSLHRRTRLACRALVAAVLVPVVLASCSAAPPTAVPTPSATSAPASPPAGSGSVAGTSTATPGPERPAATPSATATPATATPDTAPPDASLAAEGGDAVTGQLGSYTWAGGGSDSPWLPGSPVTVGAREPLSVALAEGPAVSRWSARRAPGTTNPAGAVALGSGSGRIAFGAPAAGTWTVEVSVTFAGELGSATYYWRLKVR